MPIYFASAADHATHDEVVVGFYKRGAGKPTLTWPESVDQALCFGGSIWSNINVAKVGSLVRAGHMMPAGERAFAARDEAKTGVYSFERARAATLAAPDAKRFRAEPAAWKYFMKQPPSHRRAAYHWVISAKQDATRVRRLATLIADSAAKRWVKPLRRR